MANKKNDDNKATNKYSDVAADSASVKEEVVGVESVQLEAERGEEQEMEYVLVNNGSYVNLQKMSSPSRQALQRDETDGDETFYENSPYATKQFQETDKKELENERLDNTGVYVNKEEFKRPTSLPTRSSEADVNNDDMYVNTFLAREEIAEDSPIYANQEVVMSMRTNKAYGINDRPGDQQLQQQGEVDNSGEEYVYVDVNADRPEPEDEYEELADFGVKTFAKKSS